jgi:hypothetical protein
MDYGGMRTHGEKNTSSSWQWKDHKWRFLSPPPVYLSNPQKSNFTPQNFGKYEPDFWKLQFLFTEIFRYRKTSVSTVYFSKNPKNSVNIFRIFQKKWF